MAAGAQKHTNHYTGEHARPAASQIEQASRSRTAGRASTPLRERTRLSDRQCTRTGCSEHAEVTLTYDYHQSHVWLDALQPERDPHAYDMCARHAARLSVPSGWHLDDRRGARRSDLIAV